MSTRANVLIVDDDVSIRTLLKEYLEQNGFRASTAADGQALREHLRKVPVDLIVLDLMLPEEDGFSLCRWIRSFRDTPIIMLTARNQPEDQMYGFKVGADDYVTKPFDTEEVLARVRTALRHRLSATTEAAIVHIGDIEIDLDARLVRKLGTEVHLTPKEYAFLAALAKHPGRVVTHSQLLRDIWGAGHAGDVEYLRVAARGVRRKLEEDAMRPSVIRNEPGVGYRLRP